MKVFQVQSWIAAGVAALLGLGWAAAPVMGHCDAVDGPVAKDVYISLEAQDVTDVLKWVTAEDEAEVRRVFEQAQRVRALGGEAAELADRHFLETTIRLHRQSEGAPYTGLKPAGSGATPTVEAVDTALAEQSIEPLLDSLRHQLDQAVRSRYEQAVATAAHADDSVAQGRLSVEAYVEFIHYVEHLHELLMLEPAGHEGHASHASHASHAAHE